MKKKCFELGFVFCLLFLTVVNVFSNNCNTVFTDIYKRHAWGTVSVSGGGSDLIQTKSIREQIPGLLTRFGCNVFVDAPCGDFYWMRHVNLPISQYIGADVVNELIEINNREFSSDRVRFINLDLTRDVLPKGDIILCRDCLVHLCYADIARVIRNFKTSGSTYLLTTTFTHRTSNIDISNGGWRPINLMLPPFNFPSPLVVILENCTQENGEDKSLALWKLSDLPSF